MSIKGYRKLAPDEIITAGRQWRDYATWNNWIDMLDTCYGPAAHSIRAYLMLQDGDSWIIDRVSDVTDQDGQAVPVNLDSPFLLELTGNMWNEGEREELDALRQMGTPVYNLCESLPGVWGLITEYFGLHQGLGIDLYGGYMWQSPAFYRDRPPSRDYPALLFQVDDQ